MAQELYCARCGRQILGLHIVDLVSRLRYHRKCKPDDGETDTDDPNEAA